jgi:hypothetical protein
LGVQQSVVTITSVLSIVIWGGNSKNSQFFHSPA